MSLVLHSCKASSHAFYPWRISIFTFRKTEIWGDTATFPRLRCWGCGNWHTGAVYGSFQSVIRPCAIRVLPKRCFILGSSWSLGFRRNLTLLTMSVPWEWHLLILCFTAGCSCAFDSFTFSCIITTSVVGIWRMPRLMCDLGLLHFNASQFLIFEIVNFPRSLLGYSFSFSAAARFLYLSLWARIPIGK